MSNHLGHPDGTLYVRIAANGTRHHIARPGPDDWQWETACGHPCDPAAVTEGTGLTFDGPHVTLCPACARAARA